MSEVSNKEKSTFFIPLILQFLSRKLLLEGTKIRGTNNRVLVLRKSNKINNINS